MRAVWCNMDAWGEIAKTHISNKAPTQDLQFTRLTLYH